MKYLDLIKEIEIEIKNVEKKQEQCQLKLTKLDNLIEKLMIVIEYDKFSSAQAYNYCKTLKELLIRKRDYIDKCDKYRNILDLLNSDLINNELCNKNKMLGNRKFTGKVFSKPDQIKLYIKTNE